MFWYQLLSLFCDRKLFAPQVASAPPSSTGWPSRIWRGLTPNEANSALQRQGLRRSERSRAPSRQLPRRLQLYCSCLKVHVQLLQEEQQRPHRQRNVPTQLMRLRLQLLPCRPERRDHTSLPHWCRHQPDWVRQFLFRLQSKQRLVHQWIWRSSRNTRKLAREPRSSSWS